MKHRVAGRKLGRTSAHRLALLRNMATSLFDKERIRTTLGKAKELRPFAEKLLTLAKRETLHARRLVLRHVHDRAVVAKMFETHSARYAQRPGGYTRIIKLGPRRGDNAEMAIIELVGAEIVAPKKKAPGKAKGKGADAEPTKAATPEATPAKAEKAEKAPKKKAAEKPKKEKAAKPAKPAKPARKAAPPKAAKAKPPAAAKKTAPAKSKKGGD